jgi:hypothetical protein
VANCSCSAICTSVLSAMVRLVVHTQVTREETQRVLDTPEKVLRLERETVLRSPLWTLRWPLLLLGCCLVGKGARDLLHGFAADDRGHWSVPFTNDRGLLLGHLCCAGPFLMVTVVQKLLIPWVGANPATRSSYHRAVGRVAVLSGVMASSSALLLSPGALAGTAVVFAPWSMLWLLSCVMTWRKAIVGDWASHRAWANLLSQSALLFITGRVALMLCMAAELPVSDSYYWSMLLAGLAAGLRFAVDSSVWHASLQQRLRKTKLQSAARRAWLFGALKRHDD